MARKSFLSHVSETGFFYTLSPTTKILLMVILNYLIFTTTNLTLISTYLSLAFILILTARIPFEEIQGYFKGAGFMLVTVFLSYAFLSRTPGHTILQFWAFHLTDASVALSITMGLRLCALLLVMILFLLTSDQKDVILGLRELRVPYALCFIFALAFRFAAIFTDDINTIIQAQKARGVNFHKGGLFKRMRSYIGIFLPVVTTYINHVKKFSNALECHGFTVGGKRNYFFYINYHLKDYVILAVLAIAVIGYLTAKYFSGWPI
ncbi:MAG: energy-coupling factor transporter transmembrane protein EcfT [Chloroflexi bacterium]|nr:energy-coupling factor transporter transmembrane protein EcfT [Chloroflexota bacterium]MCL5075452.1 energy-coupling factor transporter transmembrane protein EcfT [Chloroflexota bacterium]